MLVSRILKITLVILSLIYLGMQSLGPEYEVYGSGLSTVMLLILAVLYHQFSKIKRKRFYYFIILFAFGNLLGWYAYYDSFFIRNEALDILYYITNSFFIAAYISLIIGLISSLDLRVLLSEYLLAFIVLVVLDVFSVVIITSTTETVLNGYEYLLEFTYNAVVMTLLSFALLQYLYRNDKKSMLFLIGSICLVFSEIIQLAYYYVIEEHQLSLIYSLLLVVGFLFFYLQSQLNFTGPIPAYTDEESSLN